MNTENLAQRKPTVVFGPAAAYDNFLSDDLFREVWIWMNRTEFARVGSQRWVSIWGFDDAEVLRSQQWGGRYPDWALDLMPKPDGIQSPPVPETLVRFFAAFRQLLAQHQGLPEIKRIVMAPYIYPPQTGLTWHHDGPDARGQRVGAFTYYAHKEWNAEWGGELFLADTQEQLDWPPFDNTIVSNAIMRTGCGIWIAPKPNRIVINPGRMFHKIAKTSAAAAPRLSIQGFLYPT